MSTTAANWFETRDRFVQVCADANSQASREWDQEFAADMIDKSRKYGLETFVSAKQMKHLCRIADIDVPLFIDNPRQQSRSQATTGRNSSARYPKREDGDPGPTEAQLGGYDDDDIPF